MYYIILVFQLYLCLLCDSRIISSNPKQELIIDGQDASNDLFPYAVALYLNDQYRCTASVISPTTILTSAHCVTSNGVQLPTESFYGIANVDRTAPQVKIEFSRIIVHPDFNGSLEDDIAIMKTTSDIPFDGDIPVQPVCLARYYIYPTRGIVAGWGRTSTADPTAPEILQYTGQQILPFEFCLYLTPTFSDKKMCAEGDSDTGACFGDNGGALISPTIPPIVLGVTSYIHGNRYCWGRPAVYTRVDRYGNFIEEAANDTSICFMDF